MKSITARKATNIKNRKLVQAKRKAKRENCIAYIVQEYGNEADSYAVTDEYGLEGFYFGLSVQFAYEPGEFVGKAWKQ